MPTCVHVGKGQIAIRIAPWTGRAGDLVVAASARANPIGIGYLSSGLEGARPSASVLISRASRNPAPKDLVQSVRM
jgi:hypothetical protein